LTWFKFDFIFILLTAMTIDKRDLLQQIDDAASQFDAYEQAPMSRRKVKIQSSRNHSQSVQA